MTQLSHHKPDNVPGTQLGGGPRLTPAPRRLTTNSVLGDTDTDEYLEKLLRCLRTRTLVVGVGGAGNNAISRLQEVGCEGVETVAVNTDAQDLFFSNSDKKLLIGKKLTRGLGTGNDPTRGELAAVEDVERIGKVVDRELVFLTCGLGGGTGTGATPIIAREAKKRGALVVSICTLPFGMEGERKRMKAYLGLKELAKWSDTVIPIPNDRLLSLLPNRHLSLIEGFRVMDEVLIRSVRGVVELVSKCQLVNIDFADVESVLRGRASGGSIARASKEPGDEGIASASGFIGMGFIDKPKSPDVVREKTLKALNNPLIEPDTRSITGCLVSVTGGLNLSLKDVAGVVETVSDEIPKNANLKWGARVDPSLKDSSRVTIVGTCRKSPHLRLAESLVSASFDTDESRAEFRL
ncbi:MAG: cell division protein FtsZ [Promethearchaeota archaeon]